MTEAYPSNFVLHVGIDVSKAKSSVAWVMSTPYQESEKAFEIILTPNGMAGLHQRLLTLHSEVSAIHITMEVTANYHIHLAHFLHQQGYALSVINPLQARRFAEVFLQREKTDSIDALVGHLARTLPRTVNQNSL